MIEKTKRLISEINLIHAKFSEKYFNSHENELEKINLSQTINHVPVKYILDYRLNLHESINDYLMKADVKDVYFLYRVKTAESIEEKIKRYGEHQEKYPVNNWLNDIFGCRVILNRWQIKEILTLLDDWKVEYGLKNWYQRDKDGYKGIHVYFKNQSNFYFPWELQIWDENDVDSNIEVHEKYKRKFLER
ncbi:MAG: GTP pyrophosphokinase [Lactobacillales bacterium]|nr:GTP pyrophosphokinase [Lactobacillales bacterium]